MAAFFENCAAYFTEIFKNPLLALQDLCDIAIIAVLVYAVLRFIRDSRASQLLRGIILLVLVMEFTRLFNLTGSYYLLSHLLEYGVLALLIVFQPELRSALERMGRKGLRVGSLISSPSKGMETRVADGIGAVCDAVADMSATKTGALIVMENETKLGEIAETGVRLNASISVELIKNIFFPKASLHDGAMLIKNGRIHCAGCYLPLTGRDVSSDLGTRHRAALGVSEICDAVVIVVSEETGIISVAENGTLTRRLTPDALKLKLEKVFLPQKDTKKTDLLAVLRKGGRKDNE